MSKVKQLLEARNAQSTDSWQKIEDCIQLIFDENPHLNIITVAGFAPHFNDGDRCRWGLSCVMIDRFFCDDNFGSSFAREISGHPSVIFEGDDKDAIINMHDHAKHLACVVGAENLLDHSGISDAAQLIYTYEKDFEDIDTENGSCWTFIRTASTLAGIGSGKTFTVDIEPFEHD